MAVTQQFRFKGHIHFKGEKKEADLQPIFGWGEFARAQHCKQLSRDKEVDSWLQLESGEFVILLRTNSLVLCNYIV